MADTHEDNESPVSLDFDHAAEVIWHLVGGFSTLDEWHPGVTSCRAEGEQVGASRQVTLADGTVIDERLDRLDDAERVQVYSMISPQPPFASYTSTIHVVTTGEERCRIDWTARFRVVAGVPAGDVGAMLNGFYLSGLESLKTKLES